MFECCICHKGPLQGITIHRINAKGKPGLWACEQHIRQTDGKIDPLTKQIVDSLKEKP